MTDRFQWFPGCSCPTWTCYAIDPTEEPGKLHVICEGNVDTVAEPGDWLVKTAHGIKVQKGEAHG